MPKYKVIVIETTQHTYTVQASSIDEAEERYMEYDPDISIPKQSDVDSIIEVQP